jgi:hypothetical protein
MVKILSQRIAQRRPLAQKHNCIEPSMGVDGAAYYDRFLSYENYFFSGAISIASRIKMTFDYFSGE